MRKECASCGGEHFFPAMPDRILGLTVTRMWRCRFCGKIFRERISSEAKPEKPKSILPTDIYSEFDAH